MADFHLTRPVAGASLTTPCAPDARFVFDFATDESTMSRNGDNLIFSFADGSSVVLQDFYTAYNTDALPSFAMQGVQVAAPDFFSAMGHEDLMPAAGPAASAAQLGAGHYNEYGNMDLLGGLGRLGGEDAGWQDGSNLENILDGLAEPDEDETAGELYTISIAAENTDESAAAAGLEHLRMAVQATK